MIENERQLRHAIETIAKLYVQSDREAVETAWDSGTRAQMSEDTDLMRLRLESEVAQFLADKYGYVFTPSRVLEKAA